MNKTSIEWTHRPQTPGMGLTWNPIRARRKSDGKVGWACTHASTGCLHCYAESINKRFGTGLPFNVPSLSDVEFFLDEKILQEPLKLKKPATIFVGDMFDLFHVAMPNALIVRVLTVAMLVQCEKHVFQFLTKRAERMYRLLGSITAPPVNWWLGVSVENQKYADERIPWLLQTPAVIRFLSVEPMLEAISLPMVGMRSRAFRAELSWVICGGESGAGAREFNLAWADALRADCTAFGVPFFMKQVGSNPYVVRQGVKVPMTGMCKISRKGGDPTIWPE